MSVLQKLVSREVAMVPVTYIKLFIYITAGFIGLANIAILLFLVRYKRDINRKLFQTTRNFALSVLSLIVLYFFFLFARFLFGTLENNGFLRITDIVAFISLKYFWLKIIFGIADIQNRPLQRFIDLFFASFTVLCIINFGFFMDSQYYVADEAVRRYVTLVNILFSSVPLAVNLYLIVRYYSQMLNRIDKIFIILNSLLIHQNAWWNSLMAIRLYSGHIVLSTWLTPIADPTSIFLLLINLNLLVFIYRKDFSPLFQSGWEPSLSDRKDPVQDLGVIDSLALEHSLTVREREIALLVYQGFTNPDIAERLFISRNTVRNHIHNIFYKLNISTRIELIHLIDSNK